MNKDFILIIFNMSVWKTNKSITGYNNEIKFASFIGDIYDVNKWHHSKAEIEMNYSQFAKRFFLL